MQASALVEESHCLTFLPICCRKAWVHLWQTWEYWYGCNAMPPSHGISSAQERLSNEGLGIEILRESPLVATVPGFVTKETCRDLLMKHAGLDALVTAHIGDIDRALYSLKLNLYLEPFR